MIQKDKQSFPALRVLIAGVLLALLTAAAVHSGYHPEAVPATQVSEMPPRKTENKTGTSGDWKITKPSNNRQIEGYVSLASVAPGSGLGIHVSCSGNSYSMKIYRAGYYGGQGAKLVYASPTRPCQQYDMPDPDPQTGLVDLNWPVSFTLNVPSGWEPGVYLDKLTGPDGYQTYVPFTVRTPRPENKYLFIHSINTDEAYNRWGGNSLYSGYTPDLKVDRAVKVSFNRPFDMPSPGNNDGAGDFLIWEYPMIRFLERYGYNVDYATDVDIHEHPDLLLKYKAVIITGHDEYWSRQMRDGYLNAIKSGVNLADFAANTAYRAVRFEPDPFTGQPDRVMVDYKSAALDPYAKDPATQPFSTPNNWREMPLRQPESEILGLAYRNETSENGTASGNLMVGDDISWVFAGTGLKNGDIIPGLVGYEYDSYWRSLPHPAPIDLVFHSPLKSIVGKKSFADSGLYTYPNGGQVFDAGTMQWSWGLDPLNAAYSPKLVQVTRNILDRFGG